MSLVSFRVRGSARVAWVVGLVGDAAGEGQVGAGESVPEKEEKDEDAEMMKKKKERKR